MPGSSGLLQITWGQRLEQIATNVVEQVILFVCANFVNNFFTTFVNEKDCDCMIDFSRPFTKNNQKDNAKDAIEISVMND